MNINWPEEMLDRLKHLALVEKVSAGVTAKIINTEFGSSLTRSAVLGKAHRTGIVFSGGGKSKAEKAERKPRAPGKSREPIPFTQKKRKEPDPVARPTLVIFPLIACEGVTFSDLQPHHCRYIAGDPRDDFDSPMYCGGMVKLGSSYCPHHHALMWVKPQKKSAPYPFRMREVA